MDSEAAGPHQRIVYIQYTNPGGYPPLEHSSRILADAGWQVLFLGTDVAGVEMLRFPPHPRVTVCSRPRPPAGWRQKLAYLAFALWVLAWLWRWRPRWVYASDPLACPITWLISYWPSLAVIYHEHDSPPPASTSSFIRLCLWARRRVAERAALCVLPNAERAARFASDTGRDRDVFCVWNCPRRTEVAGSRPSRDGAGLIMLYHGSIVAERLPASVIHALALLPEAVSLRVVGYETAGSVGYIRQLQALADQVGAGERFHFIGTKALRQDVLAESLDCDVGLSLMSAYTTDPNLHNMVGASNKPFDYLACGLAILVSDLPEWRQTFVDPGYGLACDADDPTSIAQAIRTLLDHRETARVMGARGRERVRAEWHYERQFALVMNRITGGRHDS